tara:strand:+ start:2855 stop:3052 length:198 start_codon:yes stop_codon:yes gene_type:complete
MCIICIDLVRGKINSRDALNHMVERIDEIDEKHMDRILDLISEKKEEEEGEESDDEEEAPIFPRS